MKALKQPIVIGLAALTFQGHVAASTWNFAWVGNEETRYFFDADTVEKSKDVVLVWVKTVRTKTVDSDGSWASALRWKVSCSKRTIQSLSSSIYDQDGKFIRSSGVSSAESAVIPDSTGEAMLKIACEPNFPRDTSGNKYFKVESNDVFQATKNYVEWQKGQVDAAPK